MIGAITFKALKPGNASVAISSSSSVLLNDGVGTSAVVEYGRAVYDIIALPPEGVSVYSETNPLQSEWSNNNSPVVSWDPIPGASGYSYILDHIPTTIPPNTITTTDTAKGFENLDDGLWYFHIKAQKDGVWGGTGHFLLRIDTTPPASFRPRADYVVAATVLVERVLVSFFTTDNLSGLSHYEVGVIDKSQPTTVSPVFVEAESPFQVPFQEGSNLRVVVRAVDNAGNVRDESINVRAPTTVLDSLLMGGFFALLVGAVLVLRIPRFKEKALEFLRLIGWLK